MPRPISRLGATLPAVLVLLLALAPAPAQADSWAPPGAKLASSHDGRWYLIVKPGENWRGTYYQLVRRAAGAAPRPDIDDHAPVRHDTPVVPDNGDTVVLKGQLDQHPLKVFALDGGAGFVAFEQWGSVGMGEVLARYDGKGKRLWHKKLPDLFPADRIKRFSRTASSIWWNAGAWLDAKGADLLLGWRARENEHGLLRVAVADGTTRKADPAEVLALLHTGSAGSRLEALQTARRWKLEGLVGHARQAFDRKTTPALARLRFAEALLVAGDKRGADFVSAQAAQDDSLLARRVALSMLGRFLPADAAIPRLIRAIHHTDAQVRQSARLSLRTIGPKSALPLVRLLENEKAPTYARAEAVTTLWNMGADAAEALPALERAKKTAPPAVVQVLLKAIPHIRQAAAKKPR